MVQERSRARCRRIVFPPLQIICSLCCCRTCWLPSTASAGANKRSSAQKPRVSQVCCVPSASVRVASIVNRRGHQHVPVAVALIEYILPRMYARLHYAQLPARVVSLSARTQAPKVLRFVSQTQTISCFSLNETWQPRWPKLRLLML